MADYQRFTAKNLPAEYRDLTRWPQIDTTIEEVREAVTARQRAIAAYVQKASSLTAASAACDLSKAELLRLFRRCLELHPDGRIYGWRALQPYIHVHRYKRTAPIPNKGRGLAGAFSLFLAEHPNIKDELDVLILKNKPTDSLPESRLTHTSIYQHFRRSCTRAGISQSEYPLSTYDQGRSAVRRYTVRLLRENVGMAARRLGGKDAAVRARTGTGHFRHQLSTAPFDVCSCDAHQINCVGTVKISDAYIPISRLHFLALCEDYSHAVLGYTVAFARQPSAIDVVHAIQNALSPWKPRELSLPGFAYPEGAMMPSALPELAGLCWAKLLIDNATIHYSTAVAERIRRRVGCAVNYGPVGQWFRRPLIENLFSLLARRGFSRLPNSTGTGPKDPLRADAATTAVEYEILYDEILDLLDVLVCTYNATPQKTLGGRSPLEVLAESVHADESWLPRTLPMLPAHEPDIDVEVVTLRIRGDLKQGRRPYVQYHSVRYTSHVLANAGGLIGAELRCHIKRRNLTSILAFYSSGQELGVLTAMSGWDRTPHDLRIRKRVLQARKKGELRVAAGEDPVSAWLVLMKKKALESGPSRGRSRVSKAATEVAHTRHLSSPVAADAVEPSDHSSGQAAPSPSIPIELPSFLPTIKHGGFVK
jgi:putative transposase